MADTLEIGVSGLQAFQRALGTTGQNVANAATEGYNRQRVDLSSRNPTLIGNSYVGSGVQIADVTRIYDKFLTEEIRTSTSVLGQLNRFHSLSSQVDNMIADPQAGLSPALQDFFNAVQGLANDPASATGRQVLLGESETLVDRFHFLQARLGNEYNNVNTQIETSITEINSLAGSIAGLNKTISDSVGSGRQPNDLFDQRDVVLAKLAERVSMTTLAQQDGTVSVYIGSGQALVSGAKAEKLTTTRDQFDPGKVEVALVSGSININISSQLSGGTLGGVLSYRSQVLDATRNGLGRVAMGLANDVNAQHRLGQDLGNNMGGDFFTMPSIKVAAGASNTVLSGVSATLSDTSKLTTSDYRIRYDGSNRYTMTRLNDGQQFTLNASSGYPYTSAAIDGFTVTIATPHTVGDAFLVKPTADAASSIEMAINSVDKIAAASPMRTGISNSNTGTGTISPGSVTNATSYVSDNYDVMFASSTTANANGTIAAINDSGANSTLQYELRINGQLVYAQAEGAPPLANLAALASAINGVGDANVSTTGVKAYLDSTGSSLLLANKPAKALPISVSETLNTTAGVVEDGDTVTGYFGAVLTGATTPSASQTFGLQANSYVVVDSNGNTEASGAYTSGNNISFNGITTAVSGKPNLGDTFTVRPNINGSGDNRNALALAGLQKNLTLSNGTATYQDAYGQVIATVGSKTHQAGLNKSAQEKLLNHSKDAREAISGVNLDEEAANMMRYQQAYQAAAQVITTASSLFQTLLQAMGR